MQKRRKNCVVYLVMYQVHLGSFQRRLLYSNVERVNLDCQKAYYVTTLDNNKNVSY